MFQIDRSQNRLRRLEQRRFGEMNLREREHLQEWLAHQPDALGEELLILQKEFDGFADTRERLDLLALDKDGQLVIIENKLDDSGRDVTWQALKYTAYVSSLTKAQIIDIFQQYLDRHAGGGNAAQVICDFLDVEELDEIVLNPGHRQRLIFIAANFRKEVTATVLWLREHQIDARCFKVNLFSMDDQLLFDIQPVIPTPEAADFMIQMAEKESEEKSAQGAKRRSHTVREAFWGEVAEAFAQKQISLFPSISIHQRNNNNSRSRDGCHFSLILTQTAVLVRFSCDRQSAAENKFLFDSLKDRQQEIEAAVAAPLIWRRMETNRKSCIEVSHDCDGFNSAAWPEAIEWLAEFSQRMERALRRHLDEAIQLLREQSKEGADGLGF